MEISVRSHLSAGMTAAVAAGTIAVAPALPHHSLQAVQLPAPAIAGIVLTGTSFPLEQIWTLLQSAGGGGLQGIVNVVFGAIGTEFAAQAMPLVTATLNDVATYVGAAVTDVFGSGGFQVDFPAILSGVGTALGGGDFPGVLQTLTGGLTAPVTHVVQTVFGTEFQNFLATKVGTVLGALPELLRSAVQKVLGLDIKPVTDAIASALSGRVPAVSPGASTPGGPATMATVVEAPTIVCDVPAIRPTARPAAVSAAPAAASALPGSAASVPAEAAVEAAPAAPTQAAVDVADRAESDAVPRPARGLHRGVAESGDNAEPAAAKSVGPHRGAAA